MKLQMTMSGEREVWCSVVHQLEVRNSLLNVQAHCNDAEAPSPQHKCAHSLFFLQDEGLL